MPKFEDVVKIVNGKNQKKVENPTGAYPIYGSGGIIGYANKYICEANTIVIGRKGNINKPIFVETKFWNVDTAFGLVAKKEKLIPKYLYYFCENYNFEKHNSTVTIPSLTKANLQKVEISMPTLKMQMQIVHTLDYLCNLIDLRKQQIIKMDLLVKSQFIEMFGGKKYSRKKLNELCSLITDGTHQPPKFVDDGIPFLFVSNIITDHITYNVEKYISQATYEDLIKRTPIELGDVLLTIVGSYGHPAVVKETRPFCFQRHIAYLKPKQNIINSEFLHTALLIPASKEQIEAKVRGIAQKTLNLSELKTIEVVVPPIDLQNQFAAFVQQVDKSKFAMNQSLERLEQCRKALMQEAFG